MKGKKYISKYPAKDKTVNKKPLSKTMPKPKFPVNLDTRMPSDNTSSYNISVNPQRYEDKLMEILDPTGVTNYPDLISAIQEKRYNDLPIEILGSLPIVGKFGKGINMLKSSRNVPYGKFLPQLDNVNEMAQYQNGGIYKEMFPNIPGVYIADKRKIRGTTNKPINPNRDLVSGYYRQDVIDSLARTAIENGVNPYRAVAQGLAETNLGFTDDNVGHVLDGNTTNSPYLDMINAIKNKDITASKRGKIKDEDIIQAYNGYGKLMPSTEADYHGFKSKAFYGVPIPKEGLDMNKNPLYGKHVLDIQKNVIQKSPKVQNIVGKYQLPKPNQSEIEKMVGNKWKRFPSQFKKGGVIKDNRGQWAHPGEITEIGSNNITMQGVNYPVLGVSDQGDTQMMYPEQNYQFKGNKVTEYPMMQRGGIVDKLSSTLNPYNWGVEDYTNKGDFNKAYSSAKKSGEQEFMYKGKRYNTKYAGTPRQEVGAYGVNGKPVRSMDLNNPAQVNLYPTFSKKYLPGHISASIGNNNTSVDYSSKGNFPYGINPIKNKGEKSFNVYGQDNLTFSNKAASLPTGDYMLDNKYTPSDWNLFTNNCADNVCDAFGIPRSKGIQTPAGAVSKIKEKYPTLDVTGRTYEDYNKLLDNINKRANYKNLNSKEYISKRTKNALSNSDMLTSVYFSPDTDKKLKERIGETLQEALINSGYDLPKSYIKGNKYNLDKIIGNETLNALKDWKNKNQEQPGYADGGKVNILEGDLISKVIMNRNRDKNFVNRAYALGQNPGMFSVQDPNEFGKTMSHKMAYGEDDSGQAYMYPTIMNNNNEAIKVPNQYADYISSEGYKKETNMEYGKGGYTVKRSSDRKGKTHVVIGPDGTKKYFGDPNLGERGKSKYGKEAFYARHKKNLDANPYFRAYARATWEDGGMIPEQGHISMNKRSLFKYGGLTVTDLNKYELGGSNLGNAAKIKPVSATTAKIPSGSGSPTPSPTGATVSGSAIGAGIGFGAEMIGGLIPEKQYSDEEGNDLGSVKSIGESTLEYGAKGAAVTAALGGMDFGVATALGAGYGAVKGWMDKEEMEEKQKEANFKSGQRRLSKRMNVAENFGNSDVNTSQEMQFAQGGMVLDYNDPNANAELELQETFQMPNGQVGMVDGPSHENGGIAVDLPEGTRIWSDKLKYGGKTFAKHTKPITSKIARLEKEIEKDPTKSKAKQNSVMLLNQQLDHYFDVQETNKEANEMKRTFKNGGMIKRADGSYSRRGLWDNIRANKGSGKKPTPQMLEQERKINNEMAMGGMLTKYQDGDMVGNPDRVAIGAINPRTGQPYSMQEVASYTNSQKMLPTSFGTQYGGLNSQGNEVYANYEQPLERMAATNTINFPNSPTNPNYVEPAAFDPFNVPKFTDMNNPMDRIQRTLGNKLVPTLPQRVGTGNYGEFYNPKRGQDYTNAVVQNSQVTPTEIQQANAMGNNFNDTSTQPEAPGFFNKAGQFIQNNPGLIGQLGTAAITAGAQMNRVNKLARPRTLADVRLSDKVINPNLVDYSAERQAYNRMGLNAMGEAQRGFGSSAAAQAFKNKARLNTLEGTGKSYQSQENVNAQIRNQANMARQEAGMKEAMMNNEIDKYNLENVYGYDENKMRDLNAITGQMGNVASQTFGNITANKNQLKQLEMLAKGNYKGVNRKTLDDLGIDDKTYETLTGQPAPKKEGRNGGMMGRSFRNGGTNNPGFNALPESVQENILNNMGISGYMYPMGGRLMDEPMYGEGGIHIKPENKGKFTAYAKSHGKGVQEMASAVLANKENYSPTIVKRANFAKNAAGWKHEDGGYIEYAEGGNVNPYNQVLNKVANFNTSKAAEQMDAEYAAALAAGKNKYTSSITGLDYKVLPKAEKRALVVDMWRDAHGEAPTQKQIESGVKAIEGKKVTSPKAKTMAEIVEGRWKTGVATPEQMAAQMTPEEQEKYFLGIKDWGQFGKEQGAQMLDAVGSLGMSAIGNPLRSMFGTDLGFGSTDMSPEAVEAKVGNPNEYADAASNALIGIMGGKGLSMAANKIIPKFYKPAAKYFNAEARNLELQNAKKVYKANQANKNQRAKAKYYEQVPEPDIPRYVRNIAGQEDEAFALEFGKRQKDALLKKIESKLNVAEGADRIRPKRSLKK